MSNFNDLEMEARELELHARIAQARAQKETAEAQKAMAERQRAEAEEATLNTRLRMEKTKIMFEDDILLQKARIQAEINTRLMPNDLEDKSHTHLTEDDDSLPFEDFDTNEENKDSSPEQE